MRFTSSTLLTILFYVISGGLAFYLYSSIKFEVEEEKRIERSENKVIERLKVLREAQIAYREVYGQYASNMDTLMEFIDNGTFYITTRNEEIITLDYGRDSVVVSIDTLGTLPASDRIYKEFVYANATDEGVFVEYFVTEGQEVTKGDNLYTIRVNDRRESKIRAKESG
ncbi:MAG: hypothetical protein JJU23_14520, partial [Cyclobacteriaceae bacterium]|nr:hypothetical protein [Cyclobacteriaceae bacterium]